LSEKEEVLKLIKDLPDNVSLEEMMRELYIYIKFQQGVRELNEEKSENKTIDMEPEKWFH